MRIQTDMVVGHVILMNFEAILLQMIHHHTWQITFLLKKRKLDRCLIFKLVMCTGTTYINSLLGLSSNNVFLSMGLKGCKKSRLLAIIVSQNTHQIGMKLVCCWIKFCWWTSCSLYFVWTSLKENSLIALILFNTATISFSVGVDRTNYELIFISK